MRDGHGCRFLPGRCWAGGYGRVSFGVRPRRCGLCGQGWHGIAVRVGSNASSKSSYGSTVSEQTLVEDALAWQAEEGRGALRKAPGSG